MLFYLFMNQVVFILCCKIFIFFRFEALEKSCDDIPTSFIYFDISENLSKVVGHVLIEEFKYRENSVEFDLGKFQNTYFT